MKRHLLLASALLLAACVHSNPRYQGGSNKTQPAGAPATTAQPAATPQNAAQRADAVRSDPQYRSVRARWDTAKQNMEQACAQESGGTCRLRRVDFAAVDKEMKELLTHKGFQLELAKQHRLYPEQTTQH